MENDISKILDSLTQVRVDDFKTWLEVGMALHSSGENCSTWENWSRRSSKFKDGECQKRWSTFGNYGGSPITIASIAKLAIEDGYKPLKGFGFNEPIGRSEKNKTALKPQNLELKEYLSALFKSGDTVNFVVSSFEKDGKMLPCGKGANKSFDELITACNTYSDIGYVLGDWNDSGGAWARFNPMSGDGCKNSDVVEFRHCLIESDSLSKEEQLKKIKELNLPCSAIVDSGGKSIHAIVKVDAGKDEKLYRERVSALHSCLEKNGFPVDKACKNASRLSRIAAVTRNGKRQSLLATNIGAKSYEDWFKNQNIEKLYELTHVNTLRDVPENDMRDNLLGNRWLCRGCAGVVIASSGVGKSVMAMQMAIHFSIGSKVFDIDSFDPRKILFIQAENNLIDLAEAFQSIIKKANLTTEQNELLDKNLVFISNQICAGELFIQMLDQACAEVKPDIVIVDPLLSFFGGDLSKQDVCSRFLRNQLNPIIAKYNMGMIMMHHTAKEISENLSSVSYAGFGSSELTNWARFISVLFHNKDDRNIFDFMHVKRGNKLPKSQMYLKHAQGAGIYWEEVNKPLSVVKSESNKESKYDFLKLENMPPLKNDRDESKSEVLLYIAKRLAENGEPASIKDANRAYNCVRRLKNPPIIFDKDKFVWVGTLYMGSEVQND